MPSSFLTHLGEPRRLVDLPVLLRRQPDAGAVRAAALVGAAEGGRRRPRGGHQVRDRQAGRQDLGLQRGDVPRIDQRVVHRGDGVLPDEVFGRDLRAEVACARAHVAVRQLEPGPGERVRELVRVLHEAPRDLLVDRVEPQRQVRGQHGRQVLLRRVVRVRHRRLGSLGHPLVRAGRALRQLPFVAEEVPEEVGAPLRRRGAPGDLQAAGDRVAATAGAEAALPAQALLLDGGGLRLASHVGHGAGAVGLAEGVAARDERDRLLVVHRHAREGLADVPRGRDRIRIAVRALRVDVDQAHLHRRERILQVAVAGIALVPQPLRLGTPIDVLVRLPGVRAPAAEAEGLEPHRFQGDVAREDQQVGPGDLLAVLLLDRPEQPARLVEADVVRPAVERREALLAPAGAAAAVADAVRAGAVPGHADEEGSVVAEVRRPPLLRVGHQGAEVLLQGREVERLELLGVVEVLAHRAGLGRVLVQDPQVQLLRPPVSVRRAAAGGVIDRALGFA